MYKLKHMPIGISLFLISLLVLEVYYFFIDYLVAGIYAHHGYTFDTLQTLPHFAVTLFLFTLIAIALIAVIYGFIYRKHWVRKFTMIYIVWAAIWPIWGLLIGNKVFEHVIILIIYLAMEIFLMTDYVKEWFAELEYFTYGEWTLYKRTVELKSGKTVTIYFFSKHKPKSGTPCPMPEGYEVGVNEKTGLPFLRKIGKVKIVKEVKEEKPEIFTYGEYTLYTRSVDLKSGKTLDIYFFSKKKPHSGHKTPMPEGYEVGVNERTGLPYLRKKGKKTKPKPVVKKEELKEETTKKSSNVIYVVSKPQPGQVRGDWAVRSHGKIFSHHRTKDNAIKAARKIAREREATVMVQNTNGKFSVGFKPKK
jgi:hypothetical protein